MHLLLLFNHKPEESGGSGSTGGGGGGNPWHIPHGKGKKRLKEHVKPDQVEVNLPGPADIIKPVIRKSKLVIDDDEDEIIMILFGL